VTDTTIGRRLDQLRVFLVRASRQTLAVEWLDDTGQPMPLKAGATVTLEVDRDGLSPVLWSGTTSATQTSWPLTAVQTDLPHGTYKGRVVIDDGDAAGPLVALTVLLTVE
jgi:hypothetical protein